MAFCSYCGSPLDGADTCPKCGAKITVSQTVTSAQADQSGSIANDTLKSVRSLFSKNPQDCVTAAANSKAHVWAILGGAHVLITALLFLSLVRTGSVFGWGLLIGVLSFCILSGCVKGIFAVCKREFPFTSVMNLIASSLTFFTASAAVACIFSFFFIEFSFLLVFTGILGSAFMLYTEIQTTAGGNPFLFWMVTATYIVNTSILFLVGQRALSSLLFGALGWNVFG